MHGAPGSEQGLGASRRPVALREPPLANPTGVGTRLPGHCVSAATTCIPCRRRPTLQHDGNGATFGINSAVDR
jgi:hypothetical protein